MSTKQGLSARDDQGVFDQSKRAYSDSNPPETLERTQVATSAMVTPPAGESVECSPDGKSLWMKAPDGTVTQIGPPQLQVAVCSANISYTTTAAADIPGLTLSVTSRGPGDVFLVTWVLDIAQITSTAAAFLGSLFVDGAQQSGPSTYAAPTAVTRNTISQQRIVTGLAAGAHTFKIQGAVSPAGNMLVRAIQSNITVLRI